ncbi:hypothetical protein ABZ471_37185 [Streptomyces sp. NPDC005728]|uniref:hypothetical protein n=1 Tax=Streptomyces sp. NPDC005728 TaxID=3157054 RepID=UPI0033E4B275
MPSPYEHLLDRRARQETAGTAGDDILHLMPDTTVTDAARILETVYRAEPALDRVDIVLGNTTIGVATRDHLNRLGLTPVRALGDGDAATLPGESTRYVVLRFRCTTCSTTVRRLHLDPREPPACPRGHGELERLG